MRHARRAPMLLLLLLWPLLLAPRAGDAAVITGACVDDFQCDGDTCCAVSLWIRGLRLCTPMGRAGDSCHPRSRKNHFGNGRQERRKRKRRKRKKEVPFFGRRLLHTCPCMPGLACSRASVNRFVCSRK